MRETQARELTLSRSACLRPKKDKPVRTRNCKYDSARLQADCSEAIHLALAVWLLDEIELLKSDLEEPP